MMSLLEEFQNEEMPIIANYNNINDVDIERTDDNGKNMQIE